MELTVRDIVTAWPSLQRLAGRALKMQPSFWLGRQIRKLQIAFASYDESRTDLVHKYGELGKDKQTWNVTAENDHKFRAEHKELLDAKFDESIEPRPVSFLKLEEIEPAILTDTWFLWTDEAPAE